ncbi:hypothetical protein [Nostoc sp.]|uniref:hypothetical protein n=1 Tax=Nostoc sp. TaxID=1180 RepID=UPI002FFC371D
MKYIYQNQNLTTPVATTGSHCGRRVPRHKGASRSFESPDLSGLVSSGVGTPATHWLPNRSR